MISPLTSMTGHLWCAVPASYDAGKMQSDHAPAGIVSFYREEYRFLHGIERASRGTSGSILTFERRSHPNPLRLRIFLSQQESLLDCLSASENTTRGQANRYRIADLHLDDQGLLTGMEIRPNGYSMPFMDTLPLLGTASADRARVLLCDSHVVWHESLDHLGPPIKDALRQLLKDGEGANGWFRDKAYWRVIAFEGLNPMPGVQMLTHSTRMALASANQNGPRRIDSDSLNENLQKLSRVSVLSNSAVLASLDTKKHNKKFFDGSATGYLFFDRDGRIRQTVFYDDVGTGEIDIDDLNITGHEVPVRVLLATWERELLAMGSMAPVSKKQWETIHDLFAHGQSTREEWNGDDPVGFALLKTVCLFSS